MQENKIDYKQLKLLYEQIYNISLEIKSLIEKEKIDDITPALNNRNKLISHLAIIKKQQNKDEILPQDIIELEERIKFQEKDNIDRLSEMKDSLKIEIDKVNKSSKILSAYEPSDNVSAAIVDVTE